MLIFKKEKQVAELAMLHVDTTCACVDAVGSALKAYVAGDVTECPQTAVRVNQLESEADKLLRDIRDLMYDGAYLPTIRADIYGLLAAVDDVANKAEACLNFVNYQRPKVAQEYGAELVAIVDLTLACSVEFRKALKKYFKPKGEIGKVREHTKRVGELESQVDESEFRLTAAIFDSSMPLSEKLHLRRFVAKMVSISDCIEDAADELQLVSLKSIV